VDRVGVKFACLRRVTRSVETTRLFFGGVDDRMIGEQQLSAMLSEFARTLVTDFPIEAILDHLVARIVDVLPVTAAGVTLIAPGAHPHYIAASDDTALGYEKLQGALNQGPCVAAYETGEPVSMPDLARDNRFPRFRKAALKAGLAAVFTFPLHQEDGRLGALDLYRETPGPLGPQEMAAAQTLADVAAAYLLNAQSRLEANETADQLSDATLRDRLTGLPNGTLLQQRLEHAAQRARRTHSFAAVLYADLDGFKEVNHTHGHLLGDALLVAVARRLSGVLRPGDTLARVSGDEFVILCEELHAASDTEVLAGRIGEAFQSPFSLVVGEGAAVDVSISASVGTAFAGRAEEIGHQLVRDADAAMYQAKRRGAAHLMIDLIEADRSAQRQELHRDLRTALSSGQLYLAYQPIVRAADGVVTGLEALLRWNHATQGMIPPQTMVAVAEQDSLILDIGAWALQRSCRDRNEWLRQHPNRPLEMAVNVSARQLMGSGFRDAVAEILASSGTDPSAVTLEMTEGIFLDDAETAVNVLTDLKSLGIRLALDDFGTGYSSLSYLRHFPVDIVKIDQGFVADIGTESNGSAIIAAVTNLAHVLGLSVTAEGVETPMQRDQVVAMGCECAQGFYYARPLLAGEVSAHLARQTDGPLSLPQHPHSVLH
jgi:diguanylate cyclase (GGDEF)-like protein